MPIPDEPQPPRPDGTYTEMPRDGRVWPYRFCRWCASEVERFQGIATCPNCDEPENQ